MKFWQKAYLCIILVFLIGFDITAFFLVTKSDSLSRKENYDTAENERYIIQKSLQTRIAGISDLYTQINAKNLKMYAAPYGEYYVDQNIYMELYYEDEIVYSNFPYTMKERPELEINYKEKSVVTREVNGILYYICAGYLDEPYSTIKYVYIKDVQDLNEYKAQIIDYAMIISAVVAIILSAVILFLLLKLTAPIRKLNQTAKEIASGNYQKRTDVSSKDEIGELAGNFNVMADSVQAHIQRLSDITQERQRFIDNLAHEMRTPITAILGYGEFLKYANYTPEEGVKAMDYIIHQSVRIKNMTNKLMNLASLNNTKIELQTIELSQILTYAEDTLRQVIQEKHIQVKKELQVILMKGDKDLIEALILNIVENALRALKEEGAIEIKSYPSEEGFILSFADNGKGISEQDMSRVFEPFFRAEKSRSSAQGGVGLGLALCKQICELHCAKMEISSKLGIGTTIIIKFTTLL